MLPDFPHTLNMPPFDRLWMCLYARLGELCVDPRPAVRKSAGQTLFSTITAHGNLLNPPTWQAVLWQVLFPLLDKVRALSGTASSEKVNFLFLFSLRVKFHNFQIYFETFCWIDIKNL